MPWPLKEREHPFPRWKHIEAIRPGDCWRLPLAAKLKGVGGEKPATYEEAWGMLLSPEFRASGRDYVIFIRLPDGTDWCVDHASSGSLRRGQPQGWTVTGELPTISVTPSINVEGRFHGFVTNGVITDDLDGRTFGPDDGVTPKYGSTLRKHESWLGEFA